MNTVKFDTHSPLHLGIDIGGTFSDIVIYDTVNKEIYAHKELTTYDDPARGVLEGIDKMMAEHQLSGCRVERVTHATTLFTNALLERRGAKTGLITTAGFRDVLEIGRERRYELYDLNIRRPEPLVARDLRLETAERVGVDGQIRTPLDMAQLGETATSLVNAGATSIAICFIHAYRNPIHEKQAAASLHEWYPTLCVTCSHEIAPVIREYERTSTTVANAYIKPLAAEYIDSLTGGLAARRIHAKMLMMTSDGGLTSLEDVKIRPIKLLESGPAAGVISATVSGSHHGDDNLLAFDMGGTTAKLCVVRGAKPSVTHLFEAARQKRFMKGSGLPILTPSIELVEIGAGGGSIAHRSAMGSLKVGPESAGSSPGPAAYGLGGTAPTVTDANFILGYLDPDTFAGGAIHIEMEAAHRAIENLATDCGIGKTRTAWGVFDVINEAMASAASVHVAESGGDPRRFTLAATGGGGPLHAYFVAKKLGIKRVLCPAGSGVASAIGLLQAPAVAESVRAMLQPLKQTDWSELNQQFRELESEARILLAQSVAEAAQQATLTRQCECRFSGQSLELLIDVPLGPYDTDAQGIFERCFLERYREKFGQAPQRSDIELINIRVVLTAPAGNVARPERAVANDAASTQPLGSRNVYFPTEKGYVNTAIYDRFKLRPGQTVEGPAIIQEPMSTVVVGPDAYANLQKSGDIIITLRDR